jgi:hypothetical protein
LEKISIAQKSYDFSQNADLEFAQSDFNGTAPYGKIVIANCSLNFQGIHFLESN